MVEIPSIAGVKCTLHELRTSVQFIRYAKTGRHYQLCNKEAVWRNEYTEVCETRDCGSAERLNVLKK